MNVDCSTSVCQDKSFFLCSTPSDYPSEEIFLYFTIFLCLISRSAHNIPRKVPSMSAFSFVNSIKYNINDDLI